MAITGTRTISLAPILSLLLLITLAAATNAGYSSLKLSGRVRNFQSGQPETFSSGATGLGDLEASDSLKKMNKRSSMFGGGRIDKQHHLELQRLMDKRRKAVERVGTRLTFDGTGIEPHPYRSYMATIPGKQLYALKRITPPSTQSSDTDEGGSLVGPIVITRRTEELIEPPVRGFGAVRLDHEEEEEGGIGRDKFPLLGEFGSRVSLITTRKAQPSHRFLEFGPNAYMDDNESGEPDLSLAYQMDDAEPVSSQVLIDSSKLMRSSGSGDATRQQQPVATRRAPTDVRKSANVMEYMDPNYLPRIARGLM